MRLNNLFVDGFCGGGGATEGGRWALGRDADIAINHDPDAILMHMTNHPDTLHLQESIWDIRPLEVTKGRHVGLLWMSPDCKHFSKAKGGKPKDKNIRSLPFSIIMWARHVRPDVIMAENVEEIQTWGPLNKKGVPIDKRKGDTFKKFIRRLRKLGYKVEWRELIAADYGAPTTRKRWYMIARCDGKLIEWPEKTHSKDSLTEGNILTSLCKKPFYQYSKDYQNKLKGKARKIYNEQKYKPWIQVSTVLDFSDLGKSIFGRKKPLAPKTMNRIARGLEKFVFNNPQPFIMQIGQTGFSKDRNRSIFEPLSTIVTKQEHCLVSPVITPYMIVNTSNHPRGSVEKPLHTITTGGHHALTAPTLIQYHSETTRDSVRGQSIEEPIMTIDASPRYALASSFLTKFYKTGCGQELTEPLHTITTSAGHFGQVSILTAEKEEFLARIDLPIKDQNMQNDIIQKCNWVASFIMEYYGQGTGQSLDEPLHTIVTKDRFALVSVYGIDYVIVDITLRMLTPKELFKAQGFPDDYIIDRDYTGKPYPISKQVARCGNSVVPMVAKALIETNCSYLKVGERMPNVKIDDSQPQLRLA